MKLKRIFMTGVLASSMLALAACGDDAEGKLAEETPTEEKEKEVDPVQPVDPVEPVDPEEDEFTLSDALTALKNFSLEDYINNLAETYNGENSYMVFEGAFTDYDYETVGNTTTTTTNESTGQYILTLDDLTKIYGKQTNTDDNTVELVSIIEGLLTSAETHNGYVSHTFQDITETAENSRSKFIANLIKQAVFGGNIIENTLPAATKADTYKNMVAEYLEGKVTTVDGVETIDVNAIVQDVIGKAQEATGVSVSDPVSQFLSLVEPFIVNVAEGVDPEDLDAVHAADPFGFINLDLTLQGDASIEFSLNKELLVKVLTDYKDKTLAKFIADAYSTEDAPLTEEGVMAKVNANNLPGIVNMLSNLISKATKTPMDLAAMAQMILTNKIDDALIAESNLYDLTLSYGLANGTFATKVNFPITMQMDPDDDPQTMPVFAYVSYANGEFVVAAGMDVSTDKADADTLANIKTSLGIAADDELLIRDFIGNRCEPTFGYVTYLIDDEDANKSTLNANVIGSMNYKAEITKNDAGFEVLLSTPKRDTSTGKVVEDEQGKTVYEEVGSVVYSNTEENGTLFDACYGAYVTKDGNTEFQRAVSLTYTNNETEGFAFNAYYQDMYSISVTNNSIYYLGFSGMDEEEIAGGSKVVYTYYDEVDIKFNTEDAIIDATINKYQGYPDPEANPAVKPYEVRTITVKNIENGYEFETTFNDDDENTSNKVSITKVNEEDNSVYSITNARTKESSKKFTENSMSVVFDKNGKSLEFTRTSNETTYKTENEQKVVDKELKNVNDFDIKVSYNDETNKVEIAVAETDSLGRKSYEGTCYLYHSTDADVKAALIAEYEAKEAATRDYTLTKTADELKALNSSCDVRSYNDGKIGVLKDYTLTVDSENKKVSYNGTLVTSLVNGGNVAGLGNIHYYIGVSGDLSLNNYKATAETLDLFTNNNKIGKIVGKQTLSYNNATYTVVYEGSSFEILDSNNVIKTEELLKDSTLSAVLNNELDDFTDYALDFSDLVVNEICFMLVDDKQ